MSLKNLACHTKLYAKYGTFIENLFWKAAGDISERIQSFFVQKNCELVEGVVGLS